MNKDEYIALVATLNKYSEAYHKNNESIIPDTEYDKMYRKLTDYEQEHPENILPNSPSQRVGEQSSENKFPHMVRMYSLENAFNDKDLIRYLNRFTGIKKQYGSDVDTYYVDCKMDGLSCELIYDKGVLSTCTIRGDGKYGEDVTANVLTIDNVPKKINMLGTCIVHGEVVVHHADFDEINSDREKNNLPKFSNCRNYASGSLRQKDPEITRSRKLKFYAWNMFISKSKVMHHDEKMALLKELGFQIPVSYVCHTLNEIMTSIQKLSSMRNTLPYDIDGVVIKQNNPLYYKEIGWNEHAPLFSIAYKFPSKATPATITGIRWNIGRTGTLTPVAMITPIVLDGITVKNVTLNNADWISKNGVGIGAEVTVTRSADVIPKIISVTKKVDAEIPDRCPYCSNLAIKNGPNLQCSNPDCPERLKAKLTYMLGKDCLNIKGYGEKFVNELVNSKTVTSFTDIFTTLDSKSESIRQEVLNNLINRVRNIDLSNLLCLLDIPNLGKLTAMKLVQEKPTLDQLRNILGDIDSLKNVNINDCPRKSIVKWYSDPKNQYFIGKIIELDLPNC